MFGAAATLLLLMLATQADSQDLHAPANGKVSALEKELLSASSKTLGSQRVQPQTSSNTLPSKPEIKSKSGLPIWLLLEATKN